MNNISEITRQDILDIIKDGFIVHLDEPAYDNNVGDYIMEYPVKIPFYGRIDEISFLSRIYDLEKMPSKDSRYRNALGDISCHLRFGDYDGDCWFFSDDRFNLRHGDGDEPLLKFLCEMLHPAVRNEKSDWKRYLDKFNELLRTDHTCLCERKIQRLLETYKYRNEQKWQDSYSCRFAGFYKKGR